MSNQVEIPSVKLSNGQDFPLVGLGTYKTNNEPEKLFDAVKTAISYGYRHFDCALCYENEEVVGRAIRSAIDESNGSLKREDFFVVTKLWNTYHSAEEVPKCVDMQLKSFGLEYFDLYLIHWAMGFKEQTGDLYPTNENGDFLYSDVHYVETYKAMEKLLAEGRVKSIGVCNFSISQLQDLFDNCTVRPEVNQVEIHPFCQNDELIEFCQKNNIVVTGYAPLGAPDRSWKQTADPIVLEHPTILGLAQKYQKTPGQICLRWLTQRNIVVVPKSVTPSRLLDNVQIFDFTLSDEDVQEIRKLEKNFRYYGWDATQNHQFYPFKQ